MRMVAILNGPRFSHRFEVTFWEISTIKLVNWEEALVDILVCYL